MKKFLLITILSFFMFSQTSTAAINPKEQISIILFSGLGGAVLGLSTLSFYSQPQNHLRNIAIGGAVGLIGAVVFSTVLSAKKSRAEAEEEEGGAASDGQKTDKKSNKKSKDEKDDDEEDDEEAYYNNPNGVKLFLADLSGKGVRLDPSGLYVGPDLYNDKGYGVYGRILEIRF